MIAPVESPTAADRSRDDGGVSDALARVDELKDQARREIAALQATIDELERLRAEIERHRRRIHAWPRPN